MNSLEKIVKARSYEGMYGLGSYPPPGEYVITGPQVGNLHGEKGWDRHIGYVVQVRIEDGAFGSDVVFLRHPDGSLSTSENQSYHRVTGDALERIKALYPDDITPEQEDYTKPFTIADEYPEIGKIIEAKESGRPKNESPLMQITTTSQAGDKVITVV